VPRERQTTLAIEVSWEPTHTFLYQLDDLVGEHADGGKSALYEALEGHERFCLDVIYTVELNPDADEQAVQIRRSSTASASVIFWTASSSTCGTSTSAGSSPTSEPAAAT
jgi:hypothetical protein